MKDVLLVKYGEIALRGKNRHLFENRLVNTIAKALKPVGEFGIFREQGRILVERADGNVDYDEVVPRALNVLGVVGLCPSLCVESNEMENLRQAALNFMQRYHGDRPLTFKVETRRANKKYPLNSLEISADIGGYLLENMENLTVDLHNPNVLLRVELRNKSYIFSQVIKGPGGLPAGSAGRGMLLLSGGIDSPVAGFLAAKRGVDLCAVYFHSPPYTSDRAKIKVMDLAARLAEFTGQVELFVVPFTETQLYLNERMPSEKLTIFLKRAMLKIAEILAHQHKCACLITGDSIGQVASQTLLAIRAVDSAAELPVIRPLAGNDKQEIIDLAQRIGTFDISIRPYEDCCTVFVDKHPDLSPKASVIDRMEAGAVELPALLAKAAGEAELIRL